MTVNNISHFDWNRQTASGSNIYETSAPVFSQKLNLLINASHRMHTLFVTCDHLCKNKYTLNPDRVIALLTPLLETQERFSYLAVLNFSGLLRNHFSERICPILGMRAMHGFSKCLNHLSVFLIQLPCLQELNLSGCAIRPTLLPSSPLPLPNAYRPILNAIGSHPSLNILHLDACRLSPLDAPDLTSAFSRNSHLTTLKLNKNRYLFRRSPNGQNLLKALAALPLLTSLDLSDTSLTVTDVYRLFPSGTIQQLSLSDNFLSEPFPKAATPSQTLPDLRSLSISTSYLYTSLRRSPSRKFDDSSIHTLHSFIHAHSWTLTELDLSRSFSISADAPFAPPLIMTSFLNSLSSLLNLSSLNLSNNRLGTSLSLAKCLEASLPNMWSLTSLSLQSNLLPFFHISPLLRQTTTLHVLDFGWNPISTLDSTLLATDLSHNTTLQSLSLQMTGLIPSSIDKVALSIASHPSLTNLNLSMNLINLPNMQTFKDSIHTIPNLTSITLFPRLSIMNNADSAQLLETKRIDIDPLLKRNLHNTRLRETDLFTHLLPLAFEVEESTQGPSKKQRAD